MELKLRVIREYTTSKEAIEDGLDDPNCEAELEIEGSFNVVSKVVEVLMASDCLKVY